MSTKNLIWVCVFVFGTIGGFIPLLWGASLLSLSSLFGNAIGGFVGILIGFKLGKNMNG